MHISRTAAALTLTFLVVFAGRAEQTARTVTTETPALEAYEWGFAYDVMRSDLGVQLNDLVLIENDGPGIGHSEKGAFTEEIHAGVLARKTLELDEAAAEEAHVILYMEPRNLPDQAPYYIIVNGHRIEGPPLAWHDKQWHWVKTPVEFLKKGANDIVVGCDAESGKGYNLLIAREDEYERGGGKYVYEGNTALVSANLLSFAANALEYGIEPLRVGEYSAKSEDGGDTWVLNSLGTTNDVVGEYCIRLNLKKYKPAGYLRSEVLDLWKPSGSAGQILPHCAVSDLNFTGLGETPPSTQIVWSVRFADTANVTSENWGAFETVAKGPNATVQIDNGDKRYMQWQATLETKDSLATPVVKSASVTRMLAYDAPPVNTFYVLNYKNPRLRQTSYEYAYENSDTPQLAQLRERLGLDALLEGATGDFDKINRLRHFVSQLWYHGSPLPEYPEWNALDVLDRRDRVGKGGMCIQFSIVFIQSLESLGYQARHINIFNHESVEVYVDELGKWVHVDPESVFDSYEYNTETGQPLNALEQHGHFLAKYGLSPENPIDWMSTEAWCNHPASGLTENKQPLDISTYTPWLNSPEPGKRPPQHNLVGFIRMMPRNNYFSQPTPRPLSQGSTWWPWDGYLNWYDDATPRKLQYALHSDRVSDFYPTLNQVAFTATHGANVGDIEIDLMSITPNFDSYEINVDDTGWQDAPDYFIWTLNRSALNTLLMRTRNKLGVTGTPSRFQIMYHYQAPYRPKDDAAN